MILFNKWVLHTAKFGMFLFLFSFVFSFFSSFCLLGRGIVRIHCVLMLMLKNRIPTLLDDMAHVLRHSRDPMSGQVYDHSRFPTQGAYEPRNLHSSHPSHWPVLQLQFDLWKCRLFVFECVIYSNVEGMKKSSFRLGYGKAGMLTFFFFPKKRHLM